MRLVGPTDPADYENPAGQGALDRYWPHFNYSRVLDFGCGCGRVARQMRQQRTPPAQYLGIDHNPELVGWAAANLGADGFSFRTIPAGEPFPVPDGAFTTAVAISVFTHILERDAGRYLQECARVLAPGGALLATWFVFEKKFFPAMQEFQNALYINPDDLTNAVWFDREFIRSLYRDCGLTIRAITPPIVRGFQFYLTAVKESGEHVPFPEDLAPVGVIRAAVSRHG